MSENLKQTIVKATVALGIAVLSALPFLVSCNYGLCFIDDYCYLYDHSFIRNGLSFEGLCKTFTFIEEGIWMPFTFFTYMLDHTIGWGAGGMHLVNILIHSANAAMLFYVLARLAKSNNGWGIVTAIVATLLWAIHPLRVESVVWVASRKDELSTFFLRLRA